jgi:hypothetical protein
MWKTFWGGDMQKLSPSNRRSVVPGGWRVEINPGAPAKEDVFLNLLEIGDKGAVPLAFEPVSGNGLSGAVVAGHAAVLFPTLAPLVAAEVTLTDTATEALLVAGLEPGARYSLQLTSNFAPGAPLWQLDAVANDAGVLRAPWRERNGRLRVRRVEASGRTR